MNPEEARRRAQLILRATFALAPVIYMVVGYLQRSAPHPSTPDAVWQLARILIAVDLFQVLILLPVISRIMPARTAQERAPRFVVRAAILEAGAIYGLVLTLMGGDLHYVVGFGIPASVLSWLIA